MKKTLTALVLGMLLLLLPSCQVQEVSFYYQLEPHQKYEVDPTVENVLDAFNQQIALQAFLNYIGEPDLPAVIGKDIEKIFPGRLFCKNSTGPNEVPIGVIAKFGVICNIDIRATLDNPVPFIIFCRAYGQEYITHNYINSDIKKLDITCGPAKEQNLNQI